MIYLGWSGNDLSLNKNNILTITESIYSNCSSAIPGMKAKIDVENEHQDQLS